jgi:hypothetical protein
MAKTAFRPETDGFPFINAWTMKPDERSAMRQALTASADEAANSVGSDPFGMIRTMVTTQVGAWIDAALPDYYGLCGGMAFAAADHFRARKPVPHGLEATHTPNSDDPVDRALRDYLWQRQLESLRPNAPVLLSWMVMLHLPIPGAGPGWLRDRTREQFNNLPSFLAHGPWPLCLIGSSTSPFNNHQVLAIGAEDHGDGTGVVYLYDSNGPGREHTIRLDFRGELLQAEESCPSPERGPLRGFFCEHYAPATPPDLPRGSMPKPATKPAASAKKPATRPATKPAAKPTAKPAAKPVTKPAAGAEQPAPRPATNAKKPGVAKRLTKPTTRAASDAEKPSPAAGAEQPAPRPRKTRRPT